MRFLHYSWKVSPPSCSITRLGIDSLSLRNAELRVREQGRCTNKTELLLNEWLVQGGWDICSLLLTWRQIKQVRSSCWMKTRPPTHPPFELPPCFFTWSVKRGRVVMHWALCPRWSSNENRPLSCGLFLCEWKRWHIPRLGTWFYRQGWPPLTDEESLDLGNLCTEIWKTVILLSKFCQPRLRRSSKLAKRLLDDESWTPSFHIGS